nr:Gag-Pol polyprotein [Tanacetum cinerariifolium]
MAAKFEIEKFNGNNFSLLKLKMKAILRKDKCLAAIGERPAKVTDDSKWDKMDRNAVANLYLTLADGVLSIMEEKKSEKEIWDHLARLYEARMLHNKNFLKRKLYALRMTESTSGSIASTSEDGNALSCEASVASEIRKRFTDVWLFDMGATFHMTARREWFHEYKPISGGEFVYSCNDHELKIIIIGSIMVKMHEGTVSTIRDVRHMEGLKKNLLSLGQLDDLGCKVEIQNKIMKIIKGALVLMRGEKVAANLYQLKGEIIEEAKASVASHSPSNRVAVTWHLKLGHIKQHRLKFKTSNSKSVYVLELVHSDVWQAPVLSLAGAKYFVSFIDDYSRRCWVYPIKKKYDVFKVFKVYKARVELDSGKKIKCLRTDNEDTDGCVDGKAGKLFKPVYVMYNTQETAKLDLKSKNCLFLGYSNDSFEAAPQHEVNETNESQAPATRTLNLERRYPRWHSDYVIKNKVAYCLPSEEGEPLTFQEALNNLDALFWKEAMQEEIEALYKNKTWKLVERYHARLVVKGYAQKEGIDFNENFSPVVRMTTIRVVLAMCATYDLHLEQLDVKTAFLYGNLEEEIYMLQPEGFKQKRKENLVCRLNKSLYALNQAPRCWYKRFDSFIRSLGYNRLHADPCAYFKRFENNDLSFCCYTGKFNVHDDLYKTRHCTCSQSSNHDGSKSTIGYVFTLYGGIVSWVSKLQSVVAMSTTEAEYVTAAQASKEAVWLKMLLEEIRHKQEKITLFCDNQSALYLARNLSFHSKTKHIRVQYHFVREKVKEGIVDMHKIYTDDNVADYLMNAINYNKFIWCRSSCGLAKTGRLLEQNKIQCILALQLGWQVELDWINIGMFCIMIIVYALKIGLGSALWIILVHLFHNFR